MNEIDTNERKQSDKFEISAPILNHTEDIKPSDELRHRRGGGGGGGKNELEVDDVENELRYGVEAQTASKISESEEEAELAVDEQSLVDVKLGIDEQLIESHMLARTELSERPSGFSFMRLLFYALLVILFFLVFIYVVLPITIPSCCDYRKDYLLFNEQNYNNDGMLPF